MVLAVISLVVMLGGTPFIDSLERNRVESLAKNIGAAVTRARSEAVARGKPVVICGSSDQTDCDGDSDWSNGWIIFVDDGAGGGDDFNNQREGDELLLWEFDYSGSNSVEVAGANDETIAFDYRGAATGGKLTIKVCPESNNERHARALLLQVTGRAIRSFDTNSNGIYEDVDGVDLDCP